MAAIFLISSDFRCTSSPHAPGRDWCEPETEKLYKMRWLAACWFIAAFGNGGGVTKTSGISQFWTDDYKVFEQVYGKTSDKDIYGETLPATVSFDGTIKARATDKKEKYLLSNDPDAYGSGTRYGNIVKQSVSLGKSKKPPKSYSFISYENSKPISRETDPETYNYLRHLEQYQHEKKKDKMIEFPKSISGFQAISPETDPDVYDYLKHLHNHQKEKNEVLKAEFPKSIGGFRQNFNYDGKSPEETEGFKSIQDILEAHEANQGGPVDSEEDNTRYLNNRKPDITNVKPLRVHNEFKVRCQTGRCRKRAANSYRVRTNPYLRTVKHRTVNH